MKPTLLLLCFLGAWTAKAECYYSNYELQLEISLQNGEKQICYQSISACRFLPDSAEQPGYLLRTLAIPEQGDSIEVYLQRYPYHYCLSSLIDCGETERQTVYAHFYPVKLATGDIRQIKLRSHLRVSSFEGISTELTLSDTAYFTRQASEVISVDGYLCSHTISVYGHYPALDSLLLQIKLFKSEVESLNGRFDSYDGDAYDDTLWGMIDTLAKMEEVITVSGCTD